MHEQSSFFIHWVSRSFIVGVITLFFTMLPSPVFGQQVIKDQLVISPAKLEVSLDPGQETTVHVRIASGFSTPVTIRVYTEDLGQSSDPFVGAELSGDSKSLTSLRGYLYPLITNFTVKPGEVVALPVTIRLPTEASAIGRFGAVIFSLFKDGETVAGAQTIVDTRVGTTIFVRPSSGAVEKGGVTQFIPKDHTYIYVWERPSFIVSFKNEGSVHLNPYGGIIVRNVFGLEKSRTEIAPWFVLPGATRSLIVDSSTRWLFGYYKVELNLAPGYGTVEPQGFVTIWVFSKEWIITLGVLVLGVVSFFLIRSRAKRI